MRFTVSKWKLGILRHTLHNGNVKSFYTKVLMDTPGKLQVSKPTHLLYIVSRETE